ncbi:hypothetical protein [Allosphingosinicella indica]|uniref:Uncharacterized protein n=1 Tax=Allosphingosinicella indica TaxID=941907 RepID=A0A1X7G1U4_9SPHN|nr:hypothetical protein [Allosphingosinicella indica]SMF62495.1 hypothetical protein SAMN06295910_1000 [Allosphingosinicella indica]
MTSPLGRTFCILAGVLYLLTAPLLAFFAMMTPMACASGRCVEAYVTAMMLWTAAAALASLTIGILAIVRRRSAGRGFTVLLIGFPFVFWAVYWALADAAGVS